MKKNLITYLVAIETVDGGDVFAFTDEADTMNFIMDVEHHVYELSMAYFEGELWEA